MTDSVTVGKSSIVGKEERRSLAPLAFAGSTKVLSLGARVRSGFGVVSRYSVIRPCAQPNSGE